MAAWAPEPPPRTSFTRRVGIFWDVFFNKPADIAPMQPIPVTKLTRESLSAAPDNSLWRLGHSTLLLKLDNRFLLTDPMFSERASPFGWLGPKRFHAPPIDIDSLPPLAAVVLSHDHYDHLDEASIRALADKAERFIAPLGVGDLIHEWGVAKDRITQLDWGGEAQVDGIRLVATPAQHFSGRSLFDSNRRLWASWVIRTERVALFFSGDSGYFDGFSVIGKRYGPFDLTLLEAGAYDDRWPKVHMRPEQTINAHRALGGRWLMPIHNGTFDLGFHRWDEPLERIAQLAGEQGIAVTTPIFGERVDIRSPKPLAPWWRGLSGRSGSSS